MRFNGRCRKPSWTQSALAQLSHAMLTLNHVPLQHTCAQHAVAGDLAFALRAPAKRLNRHVEPLELLQP